MSEVANGSRPPDVRAQLSGSVSVGAQLLAAVSLVLAGFYPIDNPDAFGHIAQGRQIAELGHVPSYDTFSFFRPTPQLWRNYEWLSDLLTYRVYALGGPNALLAAKCLLLALTAVLLVRLAERLGGARAAAICAVLIVVAIPAVRFRLSERPHLLALPLSAFYCLGYAHLLGIGRVVASRKRDFTWIAALALAHVLWVNLHGSHLLGLVFTGVHVLVGFGVPEARRKLLAVLGLQLVASCISPYGPAILVDALAHVANPVYRKLVGEWEPWTAQDPIWFLAAPILQSLALALCALPLWRENAATRALLACACVLAIANFRSLRFVGEYLLISAPVLAIGLALRFEKLALRPLLTGLGGVLAASAVLVPWGAAQLPPRLPLAPGETSFCLPAAAGHWLARHARAPRVLGAIEDSWYFMFAVPQARFVIDGRVPFYGPAHFAHVSRAFESRAGLKALIDEYQLDTVIVRHTFAAQRNLLAEMRALPGWVMVSVEDRYALFVRDDLPLIDGGKPRALPLEPSYELGWILEADSARRAEIEAELKRLPDEDGNRGYIGFVRSMLALSGQLRTPYGNGLRAPETPAELATLRSAQRELTRTSARADGVPIVDAYLGLVSTMLCDFDAAEDAFASASHEGASRETLLGAQELAVRRGELDEVKTFLEQARAAPQAAGDVWLGALRAEVANPPRCP